MLLDGSKTANKAKCTVNTITHTKNTQQQQTCCRGEEKREGWVAVSCQSHKHQAANKLVLPPPPTHAHTRSEKDATTGRHSFSVQLFHAQACTLQREECESHGAEANLSVQCGNQTRSASH
mmetsp:Transcript_73847/g.130459  ORF Transcript_73847/g.130459 Transcript_73847/m.130459 type:complete len:121 (-) Transcript_73847:585-947(-)